NKLGLKLVVYYATLVAFVALLINLFPQIIPLLPFGGLDELQKGNDLVTETDLVNLVTYVQIPLDLLADGMSITLSMLGALLVMIPVRWVYLAVGDLETAEDQPAEHKVSASLLLLPLVVTAIIVIVKFSLALAFALTGIFAGVRYRTSLKNLTDALFIFACMAVGLAAGTQALGIALALSIFFVFTAIALEPLITKTPSKQPDEDQGLTD
ncbi:MAG: DUF4956 domain-containing protein, partial [Gammaproteobacteria bacterium]